MLRPSLAISGPLVFLHDRGGEGLLVQISWQPHKEQSILGTALLCKDNAAFSGISREVSPPKVALVRAGAAKVTGVSDPLVLKTQRVILNACCLFQLKGITLPAGPQECVIR